jgi:hypothetical protein
MAELSAPYNATKKKMPATASRQLTGPVLNWAVKPRPTRVSATKVSKTDPYGGAPKRLLRLLRVIFIKGQRRQQLRHRSLRRFTRSLRMKVSPLLGRLSVELRSTRVSILDLTSTRERFLRT